MALGSQTVHLIYRPLDDLEDYKSQLRMELEKGKSGEVADSSRDGEKTVVG